MCVRQNSIYDSFSMHGSDSDQRCQFCFWAMCVRLNSQSMTHSGCTAVTVTVINDVCFVAWVGDSKVLILSVLMSVLSVLMSVLSVLMSVLWRGWEIQRYLYSLF